MLFKERHTWRHNQTLKVFFNLLRNKTDNFNEGKILTWQVMNKVKFHKQGRHECNNTRTKSTADDICNESRKVTTDIDSVLVFSIVVTKKRPDLVIWNEKDKRVMLLELSSPWEENFEQVEEWNVKRYEELIGEYEEHKWEIEFYNIAVDCRGFLEKCVLSLLGIPFGYIKKKIKKITAELRKTAEKASLFIWLKGDDNTWFEH